MTIRGNGETQFELVIRRYQYPEGPGDPWDANWLVVHGTVRTEGRGWTFLDPCLTTFEVAALAEWFDRLGDATLHENQVCSFTEPNLAFSYTPEPEPTIYVRFAHESAPPWLGDSNDRFTGVLVEFPTGMNDPRVVAQELRDDLAKFPIRGDGGAA